TAARWVQASSRYVSYESGLVYARRSGVQRKVPSPMSANPQGTSSSGSNQYTSVVAPPPPSYTCARRREPLWYVASASDEPPHALTSTPITHTAAPPALDTLSAILEAYAA